MPHFIYSLNVPLWFWERETDKLYINKAACEIQGLVFENAPKKGTDACAFWHPEDLAEAAQIFGDLYQNNARDYMDVTIRHRLVGGAYIRLNQHVVVMGRNELGQATHSMGIISNARDTVSEEEKPHFDSIMRYLLMAADNAFWDWDVPNNEVIFSNPHSSMLGYSSALYSLTFEEWLERVFITDRQRVNDICMNLVASPLCGEQYECTYELYDPDGVQHWVLERGIVVARDDDGRAKRIVGINNDITELVTMRREYHAQSERMRLAFAATDDGVWDWDTRTDKLIFNDRYLTMLGYSPKSFSQHISTWHRLLHPDDVERINVQRTLFLESALLGDTFAFTYRMLAADGEWRWVMGRGSIAEREPAGKAVRIVGVNMDISEIQEAQEKMRFLLDHDTLTGLHSRAYFENACVRFQEADSCLVSIVVCDLDGLKRVNDALGHAEGDRLLSESAHFLQGALRKADVVARTGGDEITILLPHCTEASADMLLEKIRKSMDEHNAKPDAVPILLSMGCVTADLTEIPFYKVLIEADKRMYINKKERKENSRRVIGEWLAQQGAHEQIPDSRI